VAECGEMKKYPAPYIIGNSVGIKQSIGEKLFRILENKKHVSLK